MITVTNLSKQYSGTTVLNIEHLEIPKGQSFGLVGNNGAGKTTTLKVLGCVLLPTSGRVVIGLGRQHVHRPGR